MRQFLGVAVAIGAGLSRSAYALIPQETTLLTLNWIGVCTDKKTMSASYLAFLDIEKECRK